jgi:hypothetical protein
MFTTEGLQLYSKFTDNKIGTAIVEPATPVNTTSSYYEFAQFVTFTIDGTSETRTQFMRWRKPIEGKSFYQFYIIENNNTGLVTVYFRHIASGLFSNNNSIHAARIGGHIVNGQLQPAGGSLNVTVTEAGNGNYQITATGTGGQQFTNQFNPDALTEDNANEIDFETE